MEATDPDEAITDSTATTRWFRAAAPYVHAHRNATFVIVFDGQTVNSTHFDKLIQDLALLNSLSIRLVIVFGTHPQIEQQCQADRITIEYHQDLPIIDDASLPIVKSIIGQLRIDIETKFSVNLPNTPMADSQIRCCSGNWITAQPIGVKQGTDLQHTGEVRRIDIEAIQQQLNHDNIVLLSPLGYSPTGEIFSLSAQAIASKAAIALNADKLIFIGDIVAGLPRDLTLDDAQRYWQDQQDNLAIAIDACKAGIKRVHLLDRTVDGALLQELFSHDGAGTLLTTGPYEVIRQATINDVGGILELIEPLEETGILVKRSREHLEIEIKHFTVMERDNAIIGCAALYPYPEHQLGELACLAIAQDYQNADRGKLLLTVIEERARMLRFNALYLLTTQTMHWFIERGFETAELTELPVAKQDLYNYQRNAKVFKKTLK